MKGIILAGGARRIVFTGVLAGKDELKSRCRILPRLRLAGRPDLAR